MAPHSLGDGLNEDSATVGSTYLPESVPSKHSNAGGPCAQSRLERTPADEVHDLICVGFGPASLAIAVAMHDTMEKGGTSSKLSAGRKPKVLFLEKQSRFSWHAGMLLPGAKMQISFIKDMASLRDPTSKFTFLNYLHQNGRLVEFTNLNTFLPARVEYEDYLRWCAGHFDDVVQYDNEVVSASPIHPKGGAGQVSSFAVSSKNVKTGSITTYQAKNVVLAIGGQPSIPRCLPSSHPRVIHSSQYSHLVPQILSDTGAPYRVAVIGAGQSAAEIFNNIQTLYPNSRTSLVMRSEFLKPSDDSPFVNSIFNPSYVDSLYPRSVELRQAVLADARSTNYGVVRLELIEHLYEKMYTQRRDIGCDESKWPHRIFGGTEVLNLDTESEPMQLRVRPVHSSGGGEHENPHNGLQGGIGDGETLEVDLVVAATGYKRQSHLTILEEMSDLLPEKEDSKSNGASPKVAEASINGRPVRVSRDYSVQFAHDKVAQGSGVWLQGCCEGTHGLSDTLLSILAVRSGEIVDSIFG
ncbi:L-lysine 6-monooxygenase (NADPH-requiring)-domain-containing protein [Xylariomycetidae sp. FL2044]|nr:L-lysine 6-monooxygenase (NADPH-requiring)-domain-containing protein [Xylariomycetidae sp. FL2044]